MARSRHGAAEAIYTRAEVVAVDVRPAKPLPVAVPAAFPHKVAAVGAFVRPASGLPAPQAAGRPEFAAPQSVFERPSLPKQAR